MSRRRRRTMDAAAAVLVVIILLSATTRGADPNVPSAKKAIPQKAAKPAPARPATPAKRTPSSFTPEMSFREAIDILKNSTTPPMNIVVLWKEIEENAGVYRETPIGIDGVPGLRVHQYLDLLLVSLSSTAAATLGYTVKDGIVTIGTTGSLRPSKRVTRVYDISDLVAEPARYGFLPMGFVGMGYNGLYGGSMMMPGSYGTNPGTGMYGPGVGSIPRDQGLSNAISNGPGRTRRSNSRRR